MAMLHRRRKRLAELAEREAAGESFWTTAFDEAVRTRVWFVWSDLYADQTYHASDYARGAILRDEGMTSLMSSRGTPLADFAAYVKHAEDDMMPTVIESMALTTRESNIRTSRVWVGAEAFESEVNLLLREHRISFELSAGEMIPFDSLELHTEVVIPALRLLADSERFAKAETAYRNALAEISSNHAGDAITDAATALQEALIALGCKGNALGPLIGSARTKGLLGPHDTPRSTRSRRSCSGSRQIEANAVTRIRPRTQPSMTLG